MSKLEELIEQYCPDGVEWKTYYDVCDLIRGITYNKSQEAKTETEDAHKVLRANNITLYLNALNFDDVKLVSKDVVVKPEQHLYAGDILMCAGSGSKEHVGKVAYIFQDMDYTFGGFMAVVRCKKTIFSRYMFHILASHFFTSHLETQINSSTINNINRQVMQSFVFPVPPLPVQEEIVRILDTFTELQAELQAELQKRKQQYNYYLDNLLNFNDINRGGQAEVRWMKMSDIGTFYSGLSGKTKEDFQNGNAKFISYMNIFNNPSLITDVDDRVKILEGEKQNTIQYGDLLFTGSSETPDECGMCSVLTHHTEEKLYLNSFCFGFRFNDLSGINPEFMKFLFRSSVIRKLICKTANGVTRFNISKKEFAKIVIPIPSLAEQDHVASVLDKFYFLVGDLTAGLPAEIEKRRQQYEYYRDKLLTFKRKGA